MLQSTMRHREPPGCHSEGLRAVAATGRCPDASMLAQDMGWMGRGQTEAETWAGTGVKGEGGDGFHQCSTPCSA